MAQKVQVELVDDLDGGKADQTVEFQLDGKVYEIDLSRHNAGKLRDAMACFVEAARRPGSSQQPGRRRRQASVRTATRTVTAPVQEPAPEPEPEPEPVPEPVRIAQTAAVSPRNSAPVGPVQSSKTAVIREWAKKRGMQVGDRGRISPDVEAAYYEENGRDESAPESPPQAAAASTFKAARTAEYEDEKEHNRSIREWAWENGYPCPKSGRIPDATRLAHDNAKGKPKYRNPTTRKPYKKAPARGTRALRNNSPRVEVAGPIRNFDPAVAKAVKKAVEGGAVFSDA